MSFHKWTLSEFSLTTCSDVKQMHDRIDGFSDGKCGGHWFGCVLYQRIGSVHVQIDNLRHISCDTAARKPRNIIKRVLQAGKIVQVLQGGRAVQPTVQIQRIYSRAAGAKIDPIKAHFDGSGRIASM